MKFACRRCWDYHCDCTQEELKEHDAETKRQGIERRTEEAHKELEEYIKYLNTTSCYAQTMSLKDWLHESSIRTR